MNFLNLTKKHILILVLGGIFIGLLYIGPPLVIQDNLENSGDKFVLSQFKTTRDSIYTYLPRAREIYDGHFPPSELYLQDQQQPSIRNPIPSAIFATSIFTFKGNINASYIFIQFLFAGLIFAAFYILGLLLFSRSKKWSLLFASVATLTPLTLILPFQLPSIREFIDVILKNFIPIVRTQVDKLYLYDLDNPLLTYPFYISAIASLFAFWRSPKKSSAIISAILAGLLFYVYFHYWVYWVVVIGLLFLYSWAHKNQNPKRLKNFFWLLGTLALVALPYFITYLQFSKIQNIEDITNRFGMSTGRTLGITAGNTYDYMAYIALAVLVFWVYHKRNQVKATFFGALILAMPIVWNIQLVTGFVPVPHTWIKAISPIIFIILFSILYDLVKGLGLKWPNTKKTIGIILVLLVFLLGAKKIINIYSIANGPQKHIIDFYNFDNDIVESWDWINNNLPTEPKIASPSAITSLYLTTHTSARPYLPTAFITNASIAELDKRYLTIHKLFGVSENTLQKRLEGTLQKECSGFDCFPDTLSNLNDSMWHIYGNYFASREGSFEQFVRGGSNRKAIAQRRKNLEQEKINELVTLYPNIKTSWQNLDADYAFLGPLEKQISDINLKNTRGLELVYENNSVTIYKITK